MQNVDDVRPDFAKCRFPNDPFQLKNAKMDDEPVNLSTIACKIQLNLSTIEILTSKISAKYSKPVIFMAAKFIFLQKPVIFIPKICKIEANLASICEVYA